LPSLLPLPGFLSPGPLGVFSEHPQGWKTYMLAIGLLSLVTALSVLPF
jgi:hypothetical protein